MLPHAKTMNLKNLHQSAALMAMTVAIGGLPIASASAQTAAAVNTDLTENEGYIRGCRETNTLVEVYDNSRLRPIANRIGSLPAGTEVRLTGVLAPGRAQVYLANDSISDVQPVGWVNAAGLTDCDQSQPTAEACFRADIALNVRSQPDADSTLLTTFEAGDLIYATTDPPTEVTSPSNFPNYGRVWMAVTYDNSRGWISRTGRFGTGSNVTDVPCPS